MPLKLGLGWGFTLRERRNNDVTVYGSTAVTGQLADKPTCGQSSHGLVNSWTSQLAEMCDVKFGVHNSSKCYFRERERERTLFA